MKDDSDSKECRQHTATGMQMLLSSHTHTHTHKHTHTHTHTIYRAVSLTNFSSITFLLFNGTIKRFTMELMHLNFDLIVIVKVLFSYFYSCHMNFEVNVAMKI